MKEVIVKDREGNVLHTFGSAKECAVHYHVTDVAIRNRIRGLVESEERIFEYKDSEADFERKIKEIEKKNVTDFDTTSTVYEPVTYESAGRVCITTCRIKDWPEPPKIGSSACMACSSFVGRNVKLKQVACKLNFKTNIRKRRWKKCWHKKIYRRYTRTYTPHPITENL